MKKKIILLAAALMLFAGIVSASSINGDYQGMPIVKILSDGKQLETDEVPAFIYEGHTVVPISTLRQLGASVTWDAYGYSVDVRLPNQQPITNPSPINATLPSAQEIVKSLGKEIVEFASVSSDGNGFDQITLVVNFEINDDNKLHLYQRAMEYAATTSYSQLKMEDTTELQLLVSVQDIRDVIDGKISHEEFNNRIKATNAGQQTQTPPTPPQFNRSQDEIKVYPGLYSNDGKVFLGKLTSNTYDTDSIYNEYGKYGSKYQTLSIFNEYGTYGGEYSDESPFNKYATKPPFILHNNKVIGYLTVNDTIEGAVSPVGLQEWLENNGY